MSTTRTWGMLVLGAAVGVLAWSPPLLAQDSALPSQPVPAPQTAPATDPGTPAQSPTAAPETDSDREPSSPASEAQREETTDPAVTPAGSSLPRASSASAPRSPEEAPAANQDADDGGPSDPSGRADSPRVDSPPSNAPSSRKGMESPQLAEGADGDGEPAAAPSPAKEPKRKNYHFAILLDTTLGLGNTAQLVSKPSLQGFSLDARYYVTESIGIGLGAAFDTVSQRSKDTFQWDNVTIAGTHTRQVSFTPLLAKGVYAFREHPKYAPYIALGVGAARHASQVHAGFSHMRRASWHFATAPEVGVAFSVSKASLLASLRMTYLPATQAVTSQMFTNLSLGIAIQ